MPASLTPAKNSRILLNLPGGQMPQDVLEQQEKVAGADAMVFIGPALYALSNRGRIEHDGTEWPAAKRWRRVQPKEQISVDDAAEALIMLHWAKDKEQAIRMLAARTIREHTTEFKELIAEVTRIKEESTKIGRKVLGLPE